MTGQKQKEATTENYIYCALKVHVSECACIYTHNLIFIPKDGDQTIEFFFFLCSVEKVSMLPFSAFFYLHALIFLEH